MGSNIDLTHSPTLTQATAAGVLLGTAPYMSPEQARGQTIGAQVDIWAFGCVLFEMLTGQRAFEGDNLSDILASVLKEEPRYDLLPDEVEPRVKHLLERCLAKAPSRRWRNIGDVGLDLEVSEGQNPVSLNSGRHGLRTWWSLLAAGLCLAGGWLLHDWTSSPPDSESEARGIQRVTVDAPWLGRQFPNSVSISGDGLRLAVTGGDGLFVRALSDSHFRKLEGTDQALSPVLSKGGQTILARFSDGRGKRTFQRIPFSGGVATEADLDVGGLGQQPGCSNRPGSEPLPAAVDVRRAHRRMERMLRASRGVFT